VNPESTTWDLNDLARRKKLLTQRSFAQYMVSGDGAVVLEILRALLTTDQIRAAAESHFYDIDPLKAAGSLVRKNCWQGNGEPTHDIYTI
jgi:hypothetical protein